MRGIPLIAQPVATARVRSDIELLASDGMRGRRTGERGADSAAVIIANRFAALGLQPLGDGISRDCAGPHCRTFMQRFAAGNAWGSNVAAFVPGTDSIVKDEYVVIGAHYDHLGASPVGALDPEAKDAIRNGADDNASGTAAVLELARQLSQNRPRRPVIIVAFAAEEEGLLGSRWFVAHPPVALAGVVAMINFDMVGRLEGRPLFVYGTGTAAPFAELVRAANAESLPLTLVPDGGGTTDQRPFFEHGIPVLHFFTGYHADYHRATDDTDRIDIEGELRVIGLAERVIRAVADRPARLIRE